MARPSCAAVNVALLVLHLSMGASFARLSHEFYHKSCPSLFSTVRPLVHSALSHHPRTGASIVRLFFHDCFVLGCDASVLLDDTLGFTGEKRAAANGNSLNPIAFALIDEIKAEVENVCPGVVSCADILAIAARDSVEILGGPYWRVKLGRRDSRTASIRAANKDLPPPSFNLDQLISSFKAKKLSTRDMVALSGAHTIGESRCTSFRDHIYNSTNVNILFAKLSRSICPSEKGFGDEIPAPLDALTPAVFDNSYFKNLLLFKGLLKSDQELFNGGSTDSLVVTYSLSKSTFFSDFVDAMIRMGDINPLTGSKGEIRNNCRWVN